MRFKKVGTAHPTRILATMKNKDILKLNLDGWPLPDDYLIEIGRVTSLWATLESFLNLCIGNLAGFDVLKDSKPFILVSHASFPQRLDMLGALCEQLVAEHPNLKDYKTVIGKLRSAQASRNKFMHHGIAPNPDTGNMEMAIGSARGTLKTTIQEIDLADIRKVSVEIDAASISLGKLVLGLEQQPVWKRRGVK